MNRLFESLGTDPAHNLAIEEALLVGAVETPALFLWQNAHTVVIGRGQNAWKECRTALLEEEGGTLVRRTTGGGAVYHDLGNLNFSFVMPKALYDVPRQLNVIRRAVKQFGVDTENSGRNDIVISGTGEKFSGNAFRHTQAASLHHGTILHSVDKQKLGRYLAPSKQKLQAKGVESVRARVGNLADHAPQMTIASLKEALYDAFIQEYGEARMLAYQDAVDLETIEHLTLRNRTWEWVYGRTPRFDITLEERFPWGQVELQLSLQKGSIQEAQCYTDAMDADLAERVSRALMGVALVPSHISARLRESGKPEDADIAEWFSNQQI